MPALQAFPVFLRPRPKAGALGYPIKALRAKLGVWLFVDAHRQDACVTDRQVALPGWEPDHAVVKLVLKGPQAGMSVSRTGKWRPQAGAGSCGGETCFEGMEFGL